MTGDNTPIDGESIDIAPIDTADEADIPTEDAADAVTLAPPTASPSSSAASFGVSGPGSASPSVVLPPADYSQAGVPSLDFVRDKIEGRYAQSLGSTELAQETPEARTFEEQAAKRADAAKDKLEEIRRSLRGDSSS